jgi:hypothetical protein
MIMKLIRWLLSNIILIAFVLALTYAYVYWDNLTGEDTPAGKVIAYLSVEYDEVREFMDSYDFDSAGNFGNDETDAVEPEAVVQVAETASVPQVMPPPVSQTYPPVRQPTQQRYPPVRQQTQQTYPPVRQPTQQTYPPVRQPTQQSAPPRALTQQPVARQPVARPQVPPQAMMSPPARQAMQPAHEPMPMPAEPDAATEKPASSTRELWISAREEYHRGNIDESIRKYQQVIANSSDNYDAYGELGNVYMSRGKYREAASAYFEAASILVKLGHAGRAKSLLPTLGRLDRSRAEELNQLISASTS